MSKRIEDMSDDEIASLTPDQITALATEQSQSDDATDKGGKASQEEEQRQEEQENPVLNADDDKAAEEAAAAALAAEEAAKADKADDENEAAEQAKKEAAANGAEAGKGNDGQKDAGKADQAAAADKTGAEKPAKDKPADGKPADAATATPADGDLKAFHAAITAPFKANGRDMQITSVEEVRQLMQMGANYNKKMAGMKPHLATLRTLENAKIGEAELNFLIDVHNGVPEAINKLVKDRGIDPMDLTPEKAEGYKPTNHKASDAEVELDAVLADLEGSEALPKTLDVVAKQWDRASKQIIGKHPQLLKVINAHIEAGHFDQISGEVDRQRMLGQLSGLSDLEAYRQVGDAMNESGKFATKDSKAGQPTNPVQQAATAPAVVTPDPKKADDSKRNEAKRAVAPVKAATPTGGVAPDFNPLSMSDEDFAKKFGGKI